MNKIIGLALALSFAGAPVRASSFDEARQLLADKKYPQAVAKLEVEAKANPGSSEILLNLGWAYWHSQRLGDAYRVGQTLVKLDPDNRAFLVLLANLDVEKKDYAAAVGLAEQALKLRPGDHDAGMVLARALFLQGRADEGLAALNRLIARFPDDSAAVHRKAEFLAGMGRRQEALAVLEGLLAGDPKNSAYRRSRARILAEVGRQDEAKAEWTELAREESDDQSLMNLGWLDWRQKDYDEAWRIASALVQRDGKNPAYLRFMANLEIERMNYARALGLARRALRLAPGDRDAELTVAKALFRMQNEDAAMAVLRKLIARYPHDPAVQSRWAEFLARTGRMEASLPFFDRLIKADPANDVYRLNRAAAYYEMGRFDAAVAEWRALASRKDPNMSAVRLLRDDAVNRKDWEQAVGLQKKVIDGSPSDPAVWEKLSRIYGEMKRLPEALEAAQGAVKADPVAINAYYMKADILLQMENWPAAEAAYREVMKHNPNSLRALEGLSYALEARGLYREALASLRRLQALSAPSVSPLLEIHIARVLVDSGRIGEAHKILKRLAADRGPAIVALLYHGVSPFDRTDSMPARNLRAQLLALKQKGYETITASELDRALQGKARLPQKPLLLTFDDGRTDTFVNADPILKELGFKATMFAHLSKLRKTHFHASLEEMARWQATGRWDLQAHGFEAHDPLTLDGFGRKGRFLPNRMWLASARRFETMPEYRGRLASEYEKARRGVEAIVPGHPVVAFAFPYGDFGLDDYTNTPESAQTNQALVKESFHLAFVQDSYGINTLSSNPTDLRRYEVPRYVTPRQLTSRLALNDPRVQAKFLEAQLWLRSGQLGQAQAIYSGMESDGVDEARLWADEGSAFEQGGDITYARHLFSRALAQEPDIEGPAAAQERKLLAQSALAGAPAASAEVQAFNDSDSNEIIKEMLRGTATIKSVRLGAWVGHGYYLDRLNPPGSPPHIESEEGGLRLHWFADPKLDLDGYYARRNYSDGEGFSDNYSVAASYRVLPSLALSARDGLGGVETAAAIRRGIKSHSDGANAVWDPALGWRATADYLDSRFSDSNWEQDTRVRVTRRLMDWIAVGAAYYRGDSRFREREYYTPVALNQYTGVVTVNRKVGGLNPRTGLAPAEGEIQYEGGYGSQSVGSSMVHSVKAILTLRPWDRVSLKLDAEYAQSPLYISRLAQGAISVSF